MQNLDLITMNNTHEALHIDHNDMIHLTWKHVTIRLNVTGLIYLVDRLHDGPRWMAGLEVFGTPDDGYQIWIQDVGLRLSTEECQRFKDLAQDGLTILRKIGKAITPNHLPDYLKLTIEAKPIGIVSTN